MSGQASKPYDVVVVGAGFSGLYLLHRLRERGMEVRVLEAAGGIGGTWYWNRYPGARCDVESMTYSYSFSDELQQEWTWSARYATQPEILRYIEHVAERFELNRDIQLNTRVATGVFQEGTHRWALSTEAGERFDCRYLVMATGCLSTPRRPDFEGLDDFRGSWYHTGYWPHEGVDFTGRRVGIIGTGSSAIQSIPLIAAQASHLTVFQRTANFSIPAWNVPLSGQAVAEWKANYPALRELSRHTASGDVYPVDERAAVDVPEEERERVFESRWHHGAFNVQAAFRDLLSNPESNEMAASFVRGKIRERVKDSAVAEMLCPRDHPFGSKRLCVDTDYYESYNRDNVTLVDVRRSPIEAITATGLRTADASYEFDDLVFATGFDAMTGALLNVDLQGRGGERLRDKWQHGPRTYLGLTVTGFPNLFTITGPGSPSVLTNMMMAIEQHVDWVVECIAYLGQRQLDCIEASAAAEDEWVAHVNEVADQTLFPVADSWYVGANIPGKPRVFMPYVGGFGVYRDICDNVAARDYEGFELTAVAD